MKSVSFSFAVALSALAIQSASAGFFPKPAASPVPQASPRPLVTVSGKLQPQFSIQVDPADLQRISDAFASLKKLEPVTIDINDLMKAGDEQAIQAAAQRISDLFIGVAANIADMRAISYKLAALTQVAGNAENVQALYKAFQERFQNDFDKAVNAFIVIDDGLLGALNLCKSELCAMQIGNAQKDLMAFGKEMNQGIKMKQLEKFRFRFKFEASLIQVSLGETFNQLVTPNEEHSAYHTLLGGVLAPFVTAVKGAANVGENIAKLIASPRTIALSLYASRLNPVPSMKDLRESYQQRLNDRIRQIVLSQAGAVTKTDPSREPVPGTSVGTAIGDAAKGVFSNLVEIYGGAEQIADRANQQGDKTLRGYVGLRGAGIRGDGVNFIGYALRVNSDRTFTVSFIPFNFVFDPKLGKTGAEDPKVLVKDVKLVTFTVDNSQLNSVNSNLRVATMNFHPVFQLRKGGASTVGIQLEPAVGYEWTRFRDFQSMFRDPVDPTNPIASGLGGSGNLDGFYAMLQGALTLDLSLSRKLWLSGKYGGSVMTKGLGSSIFTSGSGIRSFDPALGNGEYAKGNQLVVRNDFAVELQTKLKGEKNLAIFYRGNLAYSNRFRIEGEGDAVGEKSPYGGMTYSNHILDGISRSNVGLRLTF